MLATYLKKAGIVTGPQTRNTSHSHMDMVRRGLLCIPLFVGKEEFLWFGGALHEKFLEGKEDGIYKKLSRVQQQKIDAMCAKLESHPVVKKLMRDAVKENKKTDGKIDGVAVTYILDAEQQKESTGSDLKSTVCKNLAECKAKAIEYGYHKQGHLYKRLRKLRHFYFIFISKEAPYPIFILSMKDLADEEKYAEQEVKFLLHFYKHYGDISTHQRKAK